MCDQNERQYEMAGTLLETESCGVLQRGHLGTRNWLGVGRYARQRSSPLILLDTVHICFIHQMAPIIDPITVQAI